MVVDKKLREQIERWELLPGTVLFDRSLPDDSGRCYTLKAVRGGNSLYFAPASGDWQLDILTARGQLLYSRSVVRGQTWIDFTSPDTDIELRVYPLDRRRSVRSVWPARPVCAWCPVPLWAGLGLAVLLVAAWFIFIRKARFTGRPRGVWFGGSQG